MVGLSVVVPYSGSPSFAHTLRSLSLQTLDLNLFDVTVVAESPSIPPVGEWRNTGLNLDVCRYARPKGFDGHTAGLMRNLGVHHARRNTIVFIDSDSILDVRCLEEHLRLHRRYPNHVICGGWYELPVDHHHLLAAKKSNFTLWLSRTIPDYRANVGMPTSWENLYSGNVSLPRRLFKRVGGFDEDGHRCHDLDLGYRLFRVGARFRFSPECRAIHVEHPRSVVSRMEQANGWRHLGAKCPEIRAHAEDRALMLMRSYRRTVERCHAEFLHLMSQLPGLRCGNKWILPAWYPPEQLATVLRDLSYLATSHTFHRRTLLRLDRNCWDYQIIQPSLNVLSAPQISVLLTTCNSQRTVRRAIDSVLLQSLQSFELIVIDDASSDNTEDIVRSYGIDGRVRLVLNTTNRGLARSLNRGLELARSGLVVQLDADDWLERNCLEMIQKRFNANPAIGAVYGRAIVHEGDLSTTETGYCVESDIQLLTYKAVQAPRAYRTQLLRQLGGWSIQDIFDGRFFEDRLTLARVHRVARASFINQALYNVDSATDSLSRRNPRKTALAKLLILSAEANAVRQKLQATITRYGVSAQLMKRTLPPQALKWSIIIPAHGRTELLRYALRSWIESGALTGPHSTELLVIDDGSIQPLENTLCLQHPRIRFIRLSERHGPAHARNVGASAAEQSMLFFADADRIVPPDVLSSHHLRHRDSDRPSIVVGGLFGRKVATFLEPAKIEGRVMRKLLEQLRFDRELFHRAATATQFGGSIDLVQEDDPHPLWKTIEPLTFADPYLAGWVSYVAEHAETVRKPFQFLRLGTGNVSMSAKLFKKVGGFDTAMQPMEDWEFGARCQIANIPIISAPEVESYHQLHPADPFLHRLHKRAMDRFRRKHPSLIKKVVESSEGDGIPGVQFIKNRLAGRIASTPSSHIRTGSKTRCCSLTFDDGPHPVGTLRILRLLEEFSCTATFFLIVSDAVKYPSLVRAIIRAGCALGIHGWQHRPVTSQTTGEIAAELSNCLATIHDICGVKPRFCRPPYGITSASYFRGAAEVGLEPAGWHISSRDWHSPASTDLIADLATADILNKVLLFHDGTGDADATTESVKWLIQSAKKNTVSILSLSDFAQHLPLPPPPLTHPIFDNH